LPGVAGSRDGQPGAGMHDHVQGQSGADIVLAGRERDVHLIKLKGVLFARLFGCHKAIAI